MAEGILHKLVFSHSRADEQSRRGVLSVIKRHWLLYDTVLQKDSLPSDFSLFLILQKQIQVWRIPYNVVLILTSDKINARK